MEDKDLNEQDLTQIEDEVTEEVVYEEVEEVLEETEALDAESLEGADTESLEATEEVYEEVVEELPEEPAESPEEEAARKAKLDSYLESVFNKNYEEEEKPQGLLYADEVAYSDEEISFDEDVKKQKKEKKKKVKKEKKSAAEEMLNQLDVAADEPEEEEKKKEEEEEEKFDPNALEIVVDRIEHGLIGSLRIDDSINKPILRKGDIVQLRAPSRLSIKDFILYKAGEQYFLRRIIKFLEDNIYVAGDAESAYHVCKKDDVVAKAIGRERGKKYLSFSFNRKRKTYEFFKVNLAKFRLGERVMDADQDMSQESFEAAMAAAAQNAQQNAQKPQTQAATQQPINIDLDSELASFLDPDALVRELHQAQADQPAAREIYVDEDGNPITEEEYLAALEAQNASQAEDDDVEVEEYQEEESE